MKLKTSPGKVLIIDLDKISIDGLQESLIAFQLLEMGAPNSSMVKSYGRLKYSKGRVLTDYWLQQI